MNIKSNSIKAKLENRILALSNLADVAIARNQNEVALHFLGQANNLRDKIEEMDFRFKNHKENIQK